MRIQPWTEPQLMAREDSFELRVERAVKATMRVLTSQLENGALTASVTLPGPPPETAPPVSFTTVEGAVMATWTAAVDSDLMPFLVDTFTDSAARVVAGVSKATGFAVEQLTNVYAEQFLAQAHNRMVGIGEQVWQKLRSELVDGFKAGEGIDQIAGRLQQVAALATPRALTVARTEVISAANAGSYFQMIDAGFDDGEVTKVWLATEDPRTRKSHRHADNQGVDLTGEFAVQIYAGDVQVGEEFLEFPGDPSGTPGNIINCRCSLAFDFNEDTVVTAAVWIEKQHPRDNDGKFKKKGAPDTFIKIPDTKPTNSSPDAEKVAWIVAHKWDSLSASQKAVTIKSLKQDTWDVLPPEIKDKIKDAPSTTSHPESQKILEKALDEKLPQLGLVTPEEAFKEKNDAMKAANAAKKGDGKRALGGVNTKNGKPLEPGKSVQLKVNFLFNNTFEDGAIMAVRNDERLVWDGKNEKILRQKKVNGKFETTDTKTRGAAYAAWKDEDGWTVPDAKALEAEAAGADAPASVGKQVAIKVQLVYQTPFNDGDTVAVNPSTGEKITWNAGKKRMVVHHADGSTTEYTRGALMAKYKDETGWHLPGETAPAAPEPPAAPSGPQPLKKFTPEEGGDIVSSLDNASVDPGTLLFEDSNITLHKTADDDLFIVNKNTGNTAIVKNSKVDSGTINEAVQNVSKKPYVPPTMLSPEANEQMKDAVNDPSVPNSTVLFDSGMTKIVKVGNGQADMIGEKNGETSFLEIGQDEWNTDTLITKAVKIQDAITAKINAKAAAPKPVTAIQSTNLLTTDDEVTDIKELFDQPNAYVDDLLFENPDFKITKFTDTSVKVSSKHGDYDAVYDIDELTGGKLDDFADDAPQAPKATGYVQPTHIGADGDAVISAGMDSPSVPVGTVLFGTSGGKSIVKTGDGTAEVKFGPDYPGVPLDAVAALNTANTMKAFLDSKSAGPLTPGNTPNASPGGSGGVSAGQAPDFDALHAAMANSASGDKLYEDDHIAIIASKKNIWVYPKYSSGKLNNFDKEAIDKTNLTKVLFDATVAQVADESDAGAYGSVPAVSAPAVTAPAITPTVDVTPSSPMPDVATLKPTGKTLGTHGGKVFKDNAGNEWLFKPSPAGFSASAEVDLVTAKLHQELGLLTPATGIVEINGQKGSLQRIVASSTTPWSTTFDPKTISTTDALAIQKEQIFDWLVANHDAHAMNLLKHSSGAVIGIDKGQSFKWLGQDKLDYDFKPNEHQQAGNVLFKAFAKGQDVKISNPAVTPALSDFLDKIQDIPDADYKNMIRPYAIQAAKDGKLGVQAPSYLGLGKSPFPANDVEAFLDYAVNRKNSVKADYQAFYDKVLKEHNQSLGIASPINPPSVTAPSQPTVPTPMTQKPLKLSHGMLVGAGSTKYTHGQVLAENPAYKERLFWNANTKKFVVQQQDENGKWTNLYSYNKQAAYANLKDDAGWVTPSTPSVFDAGNTPGQAHTPSISTSGGGNSNLIMPHQMSPKVSTNKPTSLFGSTPKFSVDELKAQADKRNSAITLQQRDELYSLFRTKGAGGSTIVRLNSDPKDQFEGLLEAYVAFNNMNPGSKVSLLQILRAVDERAASIAGVANNNLFEKKLIDWLQTSEGKNSVQNIADKVKLSAGSDKLLLQFNKTLQKFQETAGNRAKGTKDWKETAKIAYANQAGIKTHTDGQQYPFLLSVAEGNALGAKMQSLYGFIPPDQKSAMQAYTGADYTPMNNYLRTFGKENTGQAAKVKLTEQGFKPIPEAVTIHRNVGTVFDGAWQPTVSQLKDFVGTTFREDAFASSSIDGNAFNGQPYRFIIEVPEGTPLQWVQNFSQVKSENEVLLASGLHYEILEVMSPNEWNGPGASVANKKAVIRMRIVPPPADTLAQIGE